MQSDTFQTPVAMIVFNRPGKTRIVFDAIAKMRPAKLLVIGDGPRADRVGEQNLCAEVRQIVQAVDWPCELLTNFADSNQGCQERVISGLNWVFSLVEDAIILEDDCLPDPSFFSFCHEMLERHRDDDRIGMISGNNFVTPRLKTNYSYYFSRICHTWGWATWRSAWAHNDPHLADWKTLKHDLVLREIFLREDEVQCWTQIFDHMSAGTSPDIWDYQWAYSNLINNRLSIVPNVNLVSNIGFGEDSTHTVDAASDLSGMAVSAMEFPLKHPPYVVPMRSFDDLEQQLIHRPKFGPRLTRLFRSLRSRPIRSRFKKTGHTVR